MCQLNSLNSNRTTVTSLREHKIGDTFRMGVIFIMGKLRYLEQPIETIVTAEATFDDYVKEHNHFINHRGGEEVCREQAETSKRKFYFVEAKE